MAIRIKNWTEFQHFKDRCPPWIKLYRELVYQRDIMMLSDCHFKVLVCLWCLASEDKTLQGVLPDIPDIAYKLRKSEKEITEAIQALGQFLIVDDINAISERYQDVTPETETYSQGEDTDKGEGKEEIDLAVVLYNEVAERIKLPPVQKLSDTRKKHLKARLKDCGGIEGWKSAVYKLESSDFCKGKNDRGWKADFDFIIRESSFIKLMEGKYENTSRTDNVNSKSNRAKEAVGRGLGIK